MWFSTGPVPATADAYSGAASDATTMTARRRDEHQADAVAAQAAPGARPCAGLHLAAARQAERHPPWARAPSSSSIPRAIVSRSETCSRSAHSPNVRTPEAEKTATRSACQSAISASA